MAWGPVKWLYFRLEYEEYRQTFLFTATGKLSVKTYSENECVFLSHLSDNLGDQA